MVVRLGCADNPGQAAVDRCYPRGRIISIASQDFVEGRTAFMEKRKPAFTGT